MRIPTSMLLLVTLAMSACQTVPRLPPANLSEPGWTLQQGQAIWRPPGMDREIAGDLLVATRENGESIVQFTKTPLPIVAARTTPDVWEIEFIPENRRFSGRGKPPRRFVWLHLGPVLTKDTPPPDRWTFIRIDGNRWRFENRHSGEVIEGYLAP